MNTLQTTTRSMLQGLLGSVLFATLVAAQAPTNSINLGIVGPSGSYTLDTIGSGFDTEIGIWDATGNLLASDDDGGPGTESSVTINLTDGIYFVAISEFSSTFEDGFVNSGSAFEPGDLETAVLNINGNSLGSIQIGEDLSVDETAFFRFEVGPPSRFIDLGNRGPSGSFTLDTIGSGFDTEIGIWDFNGNLLNSDDDGGPGKESSISINLVDGVYFVAISEFNSVFEDNFVNSGSAFEAGDIETAILNVNGFQLGSVQVGEDPSVEETGYFRFEVGGPFFDFTNLGNVGPSGLFTLDTIGSGFDTEIGVWNANGTLVVSDDDGGPGLESSATITLADGVYFLAISEFNSTFEDGFINSGSAFEAGDIETAILNINGTQLSSIQVGEGPSVVETAFFRFEVGGRPSGFVNLGLVGRSGSFTLDTIGSGFDTEIGIWDANGTLLVSDDDGGVGLKSSATIDLADGVYFVAISEFNSTFEDGFINSGSAFEFGDIETAVLNINGNPLGSTQIGEGPSLQETGFFRIVVGDPILGDVNRNGIVNFLDIAPFINVLSASGFQPQADTNGDGGVNFLDISAFILILSGISS